MGLVNLDDALGDMPDAKGFTWHEKYGRYISAFPEEQWVELSGVLAVYGWTGQVPDGYTREPYLQLLRAFSDDIANSWAVRENGRRGGRPKKEDGKEGGTDEKTGEKSPLLKPPFKAPSESPDEKPEKKQRKKEEKKERKKEMDVFSDEEDMPSGGQEVDNSEDETIPYAEIVSILNDATGKSYRASTEKTRRLIHARWEEGFRTDDFKSVCESKSEEWRGTEMERYLRPETLFGTKFEGYLNGAVGVSGTKPPEDEDPAPYEEVIGYLNRTSGQSFDADDEGNRAPIRALLSHGYTVSDMKRVVESRLDAWKDTEWEQYLRPQTLFGEKFPGYLDSVSPWKRKMLAKNNEIDANKEEIK